MYSQLATFLSVRIVIFFFFFFFFARIVHETACPFNATRITSFEARASTKRIRHWGNPGRLYSRSLARCSSNARYFLAPTEGYTPRSRRFRVFSAGLGTIPRKQANPVRPTAADTEKTMADRIGETNCAVGLNNPRRSCSSVACSFFVTQPVIQV